ncbi:class I SAM-dependent methyltransferase [uncultured Deefgea sp.]|uniref:class I SAM-dependent methyltransferase n=1 Tax=uncultured Deefgea sp. TaxID=1304914 RepID=UPI00262EF2A9|nr:class I SAM-dependent methyltransferase [uncultured Deefgea sp.]
MNAEFDHFATWLATPLGRYVAMSELAWFERAVVDIFGYKAVQLELPQIDCLRSNRMPWRLQAGEAAGTQLKCSVQALPFDEQSLDLIALPHVLDFCQDPHAVLRECQRALRPEGRLLITGFNPWSLWGLRRLKPNSEIPWKGNFVALPKLKDWLSVLDFQTLQDEHLCYRPPVQRAGWLEKSRFLDQAGDRLWPAGGGVYCVAAVKRIRGMHLIEPQWRTATATANSAMAIEKLRQQARKDRCK